MLGIMIARLLVWYIKNLLFYVREFAQYCAVQES